ncbi:MAG: hypothetical protein ACOCXR_00205 [Phototrophicaceae bacterium]
MTQDAAVRDNDLFVVDDLNQPFVAGEKARPPDALIGVVITVVVLFIPPMLGLNLVILQAWTDTADAISASLILITLVALSVDAILIGAVYWYLRRWRLRRAGRLIPGAVIEAHGDVRPGPQGSEFIITVFYRFNRPDTGAEVRNVIAQKRNDLVDEPLPAPGTPVRVLYLNPRNYRAM